MKAVLITGASTGIGRAAALHLAGQGLRVFAGVRSNTAAENLRKTGGERIHPLHIDVTDQSSIDGAALEMEKVLKGDPLFGLVNNAGIAVAGPLEFLPIEMLRQQFDVNVFGLVAVTQKFLPQIRESRGRIVNISSVSGRLASPFLGPYAASKFAVEALSDSLRNEVAPFGVRVSLVEPGPTQTPIWEKSRGLGGNFVDGLPRQALDLYGAAVRRFERYVMTTAQNAVPTDKSVSAIAHALLSEIPRTRYVIGIEMKLQVALARLLPDKWMDKAIRSRLDR